MPLVNYSAAKLFALQASALQAPCYIYWATVSSLGVVCNILLLLTIVKSKDLQSKSMCLVGSLAVAEFFQSWAYTINSLKRVIYAEFERLENLSQLNCIGQTFPSFSLASIVANFTVALALDRFIALAFPVYYLKIKAKRYVLIVNFISWGCGFLSTAMSFIDYDKNLILSTCIGAAVYSKSYLPFFLGEINAKIISTIFVSLLTILALYKRVRVTRSMPEPQRRAERQKLELGTLRTVSVIAFLYSASVAVTFFGVSVLSSSVDQTIRVKYAPIFASFQSINSCSHLIVYLSMSKSFQMAFRAVFCSSASVGVGLWTSNV